MSFSQNIAVGNIEEINNQELIAGAAEKALPTCLRSDCPTNTARHWAGGLTMALN